MTRSIRLMLAIAVGALAVQGYAQAQQADAAAAPTAATQPAAAPAPAPAPTPVAIPEEHGKPVVKADSKENFEAIVAAIHQQMQPGRRWQYMDANERATIDGSFADMAKLYDQFGSVDKMDQAAKIRLLADQSTVNSILTKKDGDRLICRSEVPVGSHLPVKTCRTFAQMQMEQRNAQDSLRRLDATRQRATGG